MIKPVNSPIVNSIHKKALNLIKNPATSNKNTQVLSQWINDSGQVLYTKKLPNGFKKISIVTAHALNNNIPTITVDSRIINPNGDIVNYLFGMRGISNFSLKGKEAVENHTNMIRRFNKEMKFLPIY